jgi:hypothetical protein
MAQPLMPPMASGPAVSPTSVKKFDTRLALPQSEPKRRRVSLDEIRAELQQVGLSQPVLSLVQRESQPSPGINAPPQLHELKRLAHLVHDESKAAKRRRICFEASSSNATLPKATHSHEQQVNMRSSVPEGLSIVPHQRAGCLSGLAIVPHVGHATRAAALLRRSSGIAVDSRGGNAESAVFVLTEEGCLMAELPVGRRPVVFSATCNWIEVARVVMASCGQALLFSEAGQLLTIVEPLRRIGNSPLVGDDDDDAIDELVVLGGGPGGLGNLDEFEKNTRWPRCVEIEDDTTIAPDSPEIDDDVHMG